MNYTQSFEEFSSSLGPTDLALYAGIGVILYILFKDKLSPVQKMLLDLFENAKDTVADLSKPAPAAPVVTVKVPAPELPKTSTNDPFFKTVASWKQTRDLAASYKCDEAVQKLDEVFVLLSPTACNKNGE